ncbi:MAG: hypothetical protein OK454_05605, partial [Thaumarchaeota archaeon]|nr:hypothetical protein [Nitrososphaerota archaeon]
LDPDSVLDAINDRMRKDLAAAHELAAKQHPLSHFKGVLQQFQEDLIEAQQAKEAKAAATPAKKAKKAKSEDEDVEMADGDEEAPAKKPASKKRKAEDEASVRPSPSLLDYAAAAACAPDAYASIQTPQRSDSVKKPKIKWTSSSTPKTADGTTSTPKSGKDVSAAKPKPKKSAEEKKVVEAPKAPELTPEEKHARKEVCRFGRVISFCPGNICSNSQSRRRRRSCSCGTSCRRVF